MLNDAILCDDQPMAATFFNTGNWLTDFVTPEAIDIKTLHQQITGYLVNNPDKTMACWDWVANQIKYKEYISARISVEGKHSDQQDYWQMPAMCAHTKVGNCANKAFLLTSLLRQHLRPDEVYCVLGNLYNGHAAGHAWVSALINGQEYIIEATRNDVPIVPAREIGRYEAVHYFNDQKVLAVPGKTVLMPMSACYSSWLRDYLNWDYIKENQRA